MAGEPPRPESDDVVWGRVKALMPIHNCGQRMQPGGTPTIGHVLVCTNCSYFEGVDPDWVDRVVEQARAEVDASAN